MLKYCAIFSLWAGVSLASDFLTFQAARVVIGQRTFTAQDSGAGNTVMGSASGIAIAGNTLFVADGNRMGFLPVNNRVLLFSGLIPSLPKPTDSIPANLSRCPVCLGQATLVVGQPDFGKADINITQSGMRNATAVASDGRILAVADTLNNRVLLWNTIPTGNGQPADIVLGQPDFTTVATKIVVDASSFRAPQGVWIQDGKLFVADTQNNRVMIWNSIPTKNNQPADVVLGQPNFTTAPILDITQSNLSAAANTMLTPVSVSSDGTRLYVADLGFNRVLIWNSIPTQNQQAADVEVGQPDMTGSIVNNAFTADANGVETPVLCTDSNGKDADGNPLYPNMCEATLNFPRFALSDGKRLYIADGGNDRVLVFNSIPAQNAARADVILGQPDAFSDILTGNSNPSTNNVTTPNLLQSASNVTPTPSSLAWDGTNLYVADPTDFRVLVFTPGEPDIPANGIRNAAIIEIFATDRIIFQGTLAENDKITVTIANGDETKDYVYTIVKDETFDSLLQNIANLINAGSGDPNVLAQPGFGFQFLELHARIPGDAGNAITVTTTLNTGAQITADAASPTLVGGSAPTTLGPGSLVTIRGTNLADTTAIADAGVHSLPLTLGGVQVFSDGIPMGLMYVSPDQINAQLPYELIDSNSTSVYARIQRSDGSVVATNAVGVPIDLQVPGIFALPGLDPRPAVAFHASNYSTGIISVDGGITAGDVITLMIQDNQYKYTVVATDTLGTIRDNFINQINGNPEEVVVASAAPAFTRIVLRSKFPGPEGDNITIAASVAAATSATGDTASAVVTATSTNLCCANVANALVTPENPARAGETIYVYATGLGLVVPQEAKDAIMDATVYQGPADNTASTTVFGQVGGVTPNIVSAGLLPGGIGIYKVVMQLATSTPTDPNSQLTISQDIYLSNVVTLPVYNPLPPTQ
jgi:uncharacterized protein (TIGR03437 family)